MQNGFLLHVHVIDKCICVEVIVKQASFTLVMLDSLQGEIHSPTRWEIECEVECVIVIETTILLHLDHRCWN